MVNEQIKKELKERVAKGLNFGIEAVEEVLDPASEIYNDFILLKSQYNDLMYVSSMNTLPYDQIEVGLNRLRGSLLGLINKLETAGLKKETVDAGLKIQALPTRRTNFFRLVDIHFQNLEGFVFVETYGGDFGERRATGREAVFEFYRAHKRHFLGKESHNMAAVNDFFADYFSNDAGIFEVYFKNIKHLITYILDSEVERQFFLDTLASLLSRFELAMIFYYALSGLDPEFRVRLKDSGLIGEALAGVLIDPEHLAYL